MLLEGDTERILSLADRLGYNLVIRGRKCAMVGFFI